MANYYCTIRTNYFKVKSEENFRALMSKVVSEDTIEIFHREIEGTDFFGFGCYGAIEGIDIDEDDCDYDAFLEELQHCVADDDAIIIQEVGNEKLRYLIGGTDIITKDKISGIDLMTASIIKTKDILNNPKWETEYTY